MRNVKSYPDHGSSQLVGVGQRASRVAGRVRLFHIDRRLEGSLLLGVSLRSTPRFARPGIVPNGVVLVCKLLDHL